MKIIAGCVVEKDNKILMVQEGLDFCYGQWNFPAGHVNEFENVTDAAVREVKEETGLDVKLKGVLPICETELRNETHVIIRFVAEVIGGKIDLAEIAMEQIALVLDDFPRKDGETFQFTSEFDEETTKTTNPFAVLQKLKK